MQANPRGDDGIAVAESSRPNGRWSQRRRPHVRTRNTSADSRWPALASIRRQGELLVVLGGIAGVVAVAGGGGGVWGACGARAGRYGRVFGRRRARGSGLVLGGWR
jgi:hypothetical protein